MVVQDQTVTVELSPDNSEGIVTTVTPGDGEIWRLDYQEAYYTDLSGIGSPTASDYRISTGVTSSKVSEATLSPVNILSMQFGGKVGVGDGFGSARIGEHETRLEESFGIYLTSDHRFAVAENSDRLSFPATITLIIHMRQVV